MKKIYFFKTLSPLQLKFYKIKIYQKKNFVKNDGHLRPNTYDILSKNYRENYNFLLKKIIQLI